MNMSVAERVSELGILRAVRWRRLVVFGEGALVAMAGAALGTAVGWAVLSLLASPGMIKKVGAVWLVPSRLGPQAALEGILFTLAAGLLGSVAALVHALRLRPAEALRHWA